MCVLSPDVPLSLKPTWPRFVVFCLSCHIMKNYNTHSHVCMQANNCRFCRTGKMALTLGEWNKFGKLNKFA